MQTLSLKPAALRPLQLPPRRLTPRSSIIVAATASPEAWWERPAATATAAAGLALLLSAPLPVEAKEVIQGFPRVVDGDTLDFSGTRVRLFGIDAPETKQSCKAAKGGDYLCGERSKQELLSKIGKAPVLCEQKNRDKYGRVVGVCSLAKGSEKEDLNAWMVQQGLAVAYRQYSKAYVPLEEEAQAAKRGIWSGTFEVPQQWRVDNPRTKKGGPATPAAAAVVAAAAAAAAPAAPAVPRPAAAAAVPVAAGGCAIKGNISSKGEKVYHVPGGAFYERTKIEADRGERFFCSTAEAEAAGWRASKS